jgi:hypothetical protein
MDKFLKAASWVCLSLLGAIVLVIAMLKGLGTLVALVMLFARSSLPWWVLAPAAVALIAGFTFLFKPM